MERTTSESLGEPVMVKGNSSRSTIIIGVLVVAVIGLLAALAVYLLNPPIRETIKQVNNPNSAADLTQVKASLQEIEQARINAVTKQSKSIKDLQLMGWIPEWDMQDGISAVRNSRNSFSSISPVWYWLNSDGSLKIDPSRNNAELMALVKSKSMKLVPTVMVMDHEVMSSVLRSETNFNRHIDSIVKEVTENNYDGIDLDYESTKLADGELYMKMLTDLSAKLKAQNKTLSFTALAKWSDLVLYQGLPQTKKIQDYSKIAPLVDEFRVMTYDYVSKKSSKIGPIALLSWMEQVIKYAIASGIPREKLVLGIHTYAFDWPERPLMSDQELNKFDTQGGIFTESDREAARAYYHNDVEVMLQRHNIQPEYQTNWGEYTARYTIEGKNRVIVYPGQAGIDARKQLAADYGIKGVSFWRIGDEGGLNY